MLLGGNSGGIVRHILSWLFLLFASAAQGADSPDRVVILGVSVVDVEKAMSVSDRAVIISGSKIEEISAAKGYVVPAGTRVIDGSGKWLIPGLWDMHVHIDHPGQVSLFLANGVTGVREMNSSPFTLALRDEIRGGKRLGPQIVAGLYADASRNPQPPDRRPVDTPVEARELVRRGKRDGYDFIKVYTGLSPEAYAALVEEAKAQGMAVAGHCPEWVGAAEASRLGQRSMEHCTGLTITTSKNDAAVRRELAALPRVPHGYDIDDVFRIHINAFDSVDEKKRDELFALFVKEQTWQTPTLVMQRPIPAPGDGKPDSRRKYAPPGSVMIWDRMQQSAEFRDRSRAMSRMARESVRAMHRANVPMLAGTDVSITGFDIIAGFGLHDELELLVGCGLTPAEALRTATINPARYRQTEGSAGTVAVGKRADLVLLDADPLADIGNVRKIAGVVVDGRWLPRVELNEILNKAAESFK